MKCPHCLKEGRSKVLESRVWDGKVWRRRTCALCLKNFVSTELAEPGLRMPNETQSRHRVKDPTPKPEERVIRSTAAHLQGVWR